MSPLKKAIDTLLAADEKLFSGELSIGLCTYEQKFDDLSITIDATEGNHTWHVIGVDITPKEPHSTEYHVYIDCDLTQKQIFVLPAEHMLDFLRRARLVYTTPSDPFRVMHK